MTRASKLTSVSAVALFTTTLLIALALVSSSAHAAVTSLKTFKTEIDVRMTFYERSIWKGIIPGCYAPQENFDKTFRIKVDSKPTSKSDIRPGTATITPGTFSTTWSLGDKGAFKQWSKGGSWELETSYPGNCGPDPAPPVPSWATSPTCKTTSERVTAQLSQSSVNDPADPNSEIKSDNGYLLLTRTNRKRPVLQSASIGASCYRTLHDIEPMDIDAIVAISERDTLFSIPVMNLQSKLNKLARGSAKSKPSFNIPISIGGDCSAMTMRPSAGQRPEFSKSVFSYPHQALGSPNGNPSNTVCMVSGKGTATVKRVSRVRETLIPFWVAP